MQALQNMTRREKIILAVFLLVSVGFGGYYGLVDKYVARYRGISESLRSAKTLYDARRLVLEQGPRVDAQFREIEDSLPRIVEGRRPDMVFAEDIADLAKQIGIPVPSIDPYVTAPTDAEGFSYLILPIRGIEGDLQQLARILSEFNERNFIILAMKIESRSSRSDTTLPLTLELAQIVPNRLLPAEDRS